MRLLLLKLFILVTFCLHAQWAKLDIGTEDALTSIDFYNSVTGMVCGANKIWKSIDSGSSWTLVYQGNSEIFLEEILWVNSEVVVAAGFSVETNKAFILRSTDEGESWNSIPISVTSLLTDIFFLDESTGYICGGNTTILQTTDGGNNWTTLLNANDSDLFSIFFVNENVGYAVGGVPGVGRILHTVNKGIDWEDLSVSAPNLLQSVYFPDTQTGFAAGQGGEFVKTEDGGDTWQRLSTLNTFTNLDMVFLSNDEGYIVGGTLVETSIQYTADSGATWEEESPGSYGGLFSIDIIDQDAFTAGIGGTILRKQIPTGIYSINKADPDIRIFPNPVGTTLTIESQDGPIRQIRIYDTSGIVVNSIFEASNQVNIDVSNLPPSIYFIKCIMDEGSVVKPIIIK